MKTIIIYFDEAKGNKQIIKPKYDPKCSILDIVCQVTHSNLPDKRNYHSFEVINT